MGVNKNDVSYRPLNPEEEYWFVRWIIMRRDFLKSKLKIAEFEEIINNHNDKKLIHKLQTENHRLENMLALVRDKFVPINPTKHVKRKTKK